MSEERPGGRRRTDLRFEPVRDGERADVLRMCLAEMDPRIASYALEPAGAARKAALKDALAALRPRAPGPSYWIVATSGERLGFLDLLHQDERTHLQLVVLRSSARGTGAADTVLDFVEREARARASSAIDLFVDRRNYPAYHLYARRGYALRPERRAIFEAPRRAPPGPRAIASLPLHAAAEALGSVSAARLAIAPRGAAIAIQQGRLASLSFLDVMDEDAIARAIDGIFRATFARAIRVSLPLAADVRGADLIAILHRMELRLG